MIKVLQINSKLLNQTQVSHTRKDIGKKDNKIQTKINWDRSNLHIKLITMVRNEIIL